MMVLSIGLVEEEYFSYGFICLFFFLIQNHKDECALKLKKRKGKIFLSKSIVYIKWPHVRTINVCLLSHKRIYLCVYIHVLEMCIYINSHTYHVLAYLLVWRVCMLGWDSPSSPKMQTLRLCDNFHSYKILDRTNI